MDMQTAGRQEVDSESRIVQPKGEGKVLEVDSGSRGVAGRQEVDSQSRIVQPKGEGMMLEVDSESRGEAGRQEVDRMSRVIPTMGGVATINKPQPQWMPEAFVRIGSVPLREIHLPVTVVGNWGSERIARIEPATNEVSPKKLKTGACQQPGSLVDLTLRVRGVGGKSVESKDGEVLPSSQSSRASVAELC